MRDWGVGGALAGLAVHFAIMAVMAAAYWLVARRIPGRLNPWLAGALYGLALYLVMYWLVLPWRWPAAHPSLDPATIASALFAHIALVGIPMALIAHRVPRGVPA